MRHAPPPVIADASAAATLFEPMLCACGEEKVATAHLDGERRLLAVTEHRGSANAVDLPIRSIIEEALKVGATGLVVAHNHPSGDPRPSKADRLATRALAFSARSLGIRLHDHLIFAGGDCRSFRGLGLL